MAKLLWFRYATLNINNSTGAVDGQVMRCVKYEGRASLVFPMQVCDSLCLSQANFIFNIITTNKKNTGMAPQKLQAKRYKPGKLTILLR